MAVGLVSPTLVTGVSLNPGGKTVGARRLSNHSTAGRTRRTRGRVARTDRDRGGVFQLMLDLLLLE
jgi:hypothetical protein